MDFNNIAIELCGPNPIPALESIARAIKDDSQPKDFVRKLLESCPNCDIIIKLLDTYKFKKAELAILFDLLGNVLMSIAGDKELSSVSVHIIRWVLRNHCKMIMKIIMPSNASYYIMAGLHFLTGMVLSGIDATYDVLTCINIHFINFKDLAQKRDTKTAVDVRTRLFYLILAFLNVGDNGCLRKFLANKESVKCLFQNLGTDSCELIVKLFKLLHENVVLNKSISKTIKTMLFNDKTCKFLTCFYFHNRKTNLEEVFSEEEREIIKQTLHALMFTLCTDKAHGVIFTDKEEKAEHIQSNNLHVHLILKTLYNPWRYEEGCDLICHSMKACPDLRNLFLQYIQLHSIPVPSVGFFCLVKLFNRLNQEVDCWKSIEMKLQTHGVKSFLKYFPFFSNILATDLNIRSDPVLRHAGILLLLPILKKSQEALQWIKSLATVSESEKTKFRGVVIATAEKIGGGMNKIVIKWNIFFKNNNAKLKYPQWYLNEYSTKFGALADISELCYLYAEVVGFTNLREVINPINMLMKVQNDMPFYTIKDTNNYLRVLKSILKLITTAQENSGFEPFGHLHVRTMEGEHFTLNESLFLNLINTYCVSVNVKDNADNICLKKELQMLSESLINNALDSWGLYSFCEKDIHVWLNKLAQSKHKDCVAFLAQVIAKAVDSMLTYLDIFIALGKNNYNLENIDCDSYEVKDIEDISKEIKFPFSLLVLSAADLIETDPQPYAVEYFSEVIDAVIHQLQLPELLAKYILERENVVNDVTSQHLKAWCSDDAIQNVSIPTNDLLDSLKFVFITRSSPKVSSFCNELQSGAGDFELLKAVCDRLLVYIDKEIYKGSKDKKLLKFYTKVLKFIIKIPQKEASYEIYSQLFANLLQHPITIKYYTPVWTEDSMHTEAERIVSVVLEHYPKLHEYLTPFFEKFLREVESFSKDDTYPLNTLFLSSYELLAYHSLERVTTYVLSKLLFPCSDQFIKLLIEVLGLLEENSSESIKPSTKLLSMMMSKFLYVCRQQEPEKENIQVALSKILSKSLSEDFVRKLNQDELKVILNSQPFCSVLCQAIIDILPFKAHLFAKNLTRILPNFKNQAQLVASLIKHKKVYTKSIYSYLHRTRHDLIEWASSCKSEENDAFGAVLDYMLQNDLLCMSDVRRICLLLYDHCNSEGSPLLHILSVAPVFEHLSKADNNNDDGTLHPHLQLLSILLQCVIRLYKTKEKGQLIRGIAVLIQKLISVTSASSVQRHFYDNKLWMSFAKQVLRFGLCDCNNGPELLRCVRELCRLIYSKRKERGVLPPDTLYQMIRSHSQFVSVMLDHDGEFENIKEELVLLQIYLVESSPEICEERHVPILLGSYGASRSISDQGILKIMHLYEENGSMRTYDPLLWGRDALSFYALEEEPGFNGQYKAPNMLQTASLLDSEKMLQTVLNFHMDIGLEPSVLTEGDPTVYDQRFLLPLFLRMTNDHTVDAMALAGKGVVSLGVAALSSHREEVWAAGAALLKNLVKQFQQSRGHSRLKAQWIWMIAILGYGLEAKRSRVPSVIVHFVARASQLLLSPSNAMYKPVLNYLYLKPSLNLLKVPELYRMFFSDDALQNKVHRMFLLHLLESGIRDDLDFKVCQKSLVLQLIIGLLTSATVTTRLRILTLNVLRSMCNVDKGAQSLVCKHSLLAGLPLALNASTYCPIKDLPLWIEAVMDVLSSLWNTWKNSLTLHTEMTNENKNGKKRMRESSFWSENYEYAQTPAKRLKTSERENIQSQKKLIMMKKKKDETAYLFTEFLLCLGRVVPKVITDGSPDCVSRCFYLLSQIIDCGEHLNESMFTSMVLNKTFLKQQINSWIDKSALKKRFSIYCMEEHCALLEPRLIEEDPKQKPRKERRIIKAYLTGGRFQSLVQNMKKLTEKISDSPSSLQLVKF